MSDAATQLPVRDAGRGRRRPAAVRAGVLTRSPGCQTWAKRNSGHQRRACRRRPAPSPAVRAQPWKRMAPSIMAATTIGDQDRVVLVPGIPVGEPRSRGSASAKVGSVTSDQHRRRRTRHPGGQEQVEHGADLVVDAPSGQACTRRHRGCRERRAIGEGAVAGGSRAAATRSAPRPRPCPAPSRSGPSRREPRRKTTKPMAATVMAEVLLDQQQRQRPQDGRCGARRGPSRPCSRPAAGRPARPRGSRSRTATANPGASP